MLLFISCLCAWVQFVQRINTENAYLMHLDFEMENAYTHSNIYLHLTTVTNTNRAGLLFGHKQHTIDLKMVIKRNENCAF